MLSDCWFEPFRVVNTEWAGVLCLDILSLFVLKGWINTWTWLLLWGLGWFVCGLMWRAQSVFLVFGDIRAASVEMESSVLAVRCDLEDTTRAELSSTAPKKKVSISSRDFFFTSGVEIHPTSWLSVWGAVNFLVGSSRALWKALMKSAAKQIRNPPCWWFSLNLRYLTAVKVNSQFSVTTSAAFLDMGLSGRICTEMRQNSL